ncbi:MAG: glutamine-hydrolyzing GMP synthase [Thermaurantimonas sp.]
MKDTILILDFGSQYTQLIARKIRELNIYCEIYPYYHTPSNTTSIKGLILSGSPFSVNDQNAPRPDLSLFLGRIPVLGICYGAQLLTHLHGGKVGASGLREYGRALLHVLQPSNPLLRKIPSKSYVWMSHGDSIDELPERFECIGSTDDVRNAAFEIKGSQAWGLQFHPEVYHSEYGKELLYNFAVHICGCEQTWTPESFIQSSIQMLRRKIGVEKVVLGLSGGVDSTVAAVLLSEAIQDQLYCIFVNNGLLRKNEFQNVLHQYREMGLNVKGVDASERFLEALRGVRDPEQKRKIIGRQFIEVFDEEALKIEDVTFLAQGTIYPDVIESTSVAGPSATIKSHHNVGGLPDVMKLKIVEPLRMLFKDEVRRVGAALGIPDELLGRHPFPGPGLAIRILGEVTPDKVSLIQEVDHIFVSGLKDEGHYDRVWQAGAILLDSRSVGVMGDERTYEYVVALRAVHSTDGMTADWVHLPYDFLARISNQIINRVPGVNRVVYDISSKPPATIEWE